MPLYKNTLSTLVQRTCRVHLRDWLAGSATSSSTATTTLADATNRNEKDDYFNNLPQAEIYIYETTDGAAPIGERRDISDFANTGGIITVSDAFSALITSGDKYSIHTDYPRADIVSAINSAVDDAAQLSLVEASDTSLVLVAGVNQYIIPEDFIYIYRITMADANGDFYGDPIPADQYNIVRALPQPRIHFRYQPVELQSSGHYYGANWVNGEFSTGRSLLIEGYKKQATLVNDTDYCYISPTYVCAQAAAYLHAVRIERNDVDTDVHATQYSVQQKMADSAKGLDLTRIPPGSKRVY